MALMQVDVSTELDCPAIKAWSEVQKSALLVTSVLCENGYFRTEFTSKLVNLFMGGIEFSYDDQYPCLSKVKFNITTFKMVEILKKICISLFDYVAQIKDRVKSRSRHYHFDL